MLYNTKLCNTRLCIRKFPDSLSFQKRLRTEWQHHKNVSYCLYGSKMHLMTTIFQKKSFPFYKFGEIMYLKNIPLESWTPYIQRQFRSAGKEISNETVRSLCETVDYQSSYVQQLAYCTLLRTIGTVTPDILQAATTDLIEQNSSIFIEQVQSLTSYQLNFLRAVISGIKDHFGEEKTREEFRLGSPSNINRLKTTLTNKELIEQTSSGIIIGDPVLKLWLSKIL